MCNQVEELNDVYQLLKAAQQLTILNGALRVHLK